MKGVTKVASFVIAMVLLITASLAGCGSKAADTQQAVDKQETSAANTSTAAQSGEAGKPDTSKKVELVGYTIDDTYPDTEAVLAELNKKTEKDINATVKLNFVSWGDYRTKYPLILASGDPVDFIFDTYWVDFADEVRKGAFMPIDDLLPKYAPELMKRTPKEAWEQAKFKGKTYMIPEDIPDVGPQGIGYREDLRIKYNVPEFKKAVDLEAYLDAIIKNEKGMKPIDGIIIGGGNPLTNIYWSYMMEHGYYLDNSTLPNGISYKMDDPNPVPVNLFEQPEVKEFAKVTKRWFEKGFWSTKNLADKTAATDSFNNGTSSVRGCDGTLIYTAANDVALNHPDWKYGFFYSTTPEGHVPPKQSVDFAVCIPSSSANPERTLMFLDKLFCDKSYVDLISYGIKDKDYVENPDGSVSYPPGVTPDKAGYAYKGSEFAWIARHDVQRPDAMRIKYAKDYDDKFKQQVINPKLLVCPIDQDNIKNEVAAVNEVISQYFDGLLLPGLSKDVDKDYATFLDKLKKAGIDKVLEETKKQTAEFLKNKN